MNQGIFWMVSGGIAYLLGAIPFGFLLAQARGVDIRTRGSGNIGATNVFRSVSRPLGVLTFALDVLKGFGAVRLVPVVVGHLFGFDPPSHQVLPLFCGVMAVVGHNWTCFLGFKGGKGVATSAGLLLGLSPAGMGIAFAVWLAVFLGWRYVSVASIAAAATLAVVVWPLHAERRGFWLPATLTCLALVSIWKHRTNIARLRAGTESRFAFGRSP